MEARDVSAGVGGSRERREIPEHPYDELAQLAPTLLFTADADGALDFLNARWTELTGLAPEALLGRGWTAAVHPEDLERASDAWQHARREGSPYRTEFRIRRADGVYRWIAVRAVAARDERGAVRRWFGSASDIDTQRRTTDALRALVEGGAIFAADPDVPTLLRAIADASLTGLADACCFDITNGAEQLERTVIATSDAESASIEALASLAPPTTARTCTHPVVAVLTHGRPVLIARADDGWIASNAPDAEYAAVWKRIGFHSIVLAPVAAGTRTLGVVTLMRTRTPAPFDAADVRVAEEIGRRAGAGIAAVRLSEEARRRARAREREFRLIADTMPHLMWTATPEGAFAWCNRRWTEYTGQPAARARGEGWRAAVHPDDVDRVVRSWRGALGAGAPHEFDVRLRGGEGSYRWFVSRANPLRDATGRIVRWYGTCTDVDEIRRATRALQVFADIGEALSESLGLRATLDAVMESVVPEYADWAWVSLADDEGCERIAAAYHEDTLASAALETQIGRTADDPRVRAAFEATGAADALSVPIATGARRRGTLTLALSDGRRSFSDEDRPFVEELARRIAPAIANAQLYERERRVARTFQEAALPVALPSVPGLMLDAIYEAGKTEALVGGDWYDAFLLPDGRLVVSIGDVAGSGLRAAVVMASVRRTIRALAQLAPDPAVILRAADNALQSEMPERFVTAFVGTIDASRRLLTFASAGHPPPLLRTPVGVVALEAPALPLGIRPPAGGDARTVRLEPGSLLVLYTDGVIEATHDIDEGERRLRAAVAGDGIAAAPAPARALRDAVLEPAQARDDVAILTVSVRQ